MYFWLVVPVLIVWLFLVVSVLYGWRKSSLGGFTAFGTFVVLSVIAVVIVLFAGPYWEVVYRTVLQPS